MITSTEDLLKKGYILFPKVLFEEQMKTTKGATGDFDAFILVLTHVNYSTTTCRMNDCTFECHRGESVLSIAHWAEIFGWQRSRTRYFFNKMFDNGIIEKLPNPHTTHIRVPGYDQLVGRDKREVSRSDTKTKDQHRTCPPRMEKALRARTEYSTGKDRRILRQPERHKVLQTGRQLSGGQDLSGRIRLLITNPSRILKKEES